MGACERTERGAAAVEFALVLVPLIWIVFGAIQYGWYFYAMQAGNSAASDLARRLSVGDCQAESDRRALVVNRLGPAAESADSVSTDVSYSPGTEATVGGTVTVTLTFQTNDFHFPFIPLPDGGAVTQTAAVRVEDTEPVEGGC